MNRRPVRRRSGGRRDSLSFAWAVLLAMTSCEPGVVAPPPKQPSASEPVLQAAMPEWFQQVEVAKTPDEARAAIPYSRIELERSACFGSCPVYTVTLSRQGAARYVGSAHVERIGTFDGDIDPYHFARLCALAESAGFFSMEPEYRSPWTCAPTAWLRIWRAGHSEPFVVEDYGSAGPIALWGLLVAIDAAQGSIRWEESTK